MNNENLTIGNYTCKSKEEYDELMHDAKVITAIKRKYNLDNPEIVQKLIEQINKNNILNSKLGLQFRKQLADLISNDKIYIEYDGDQNKIIDDEQQRNEKLVSSQENVNDTTRSENKVRMNADKVSGYTKDELNEGIEIPIVVPVSAVRNLFTILSFGILSVLIFYLSYSFKSEYGAICLGVLLFYLFFIGCKNISDMNKVAKKIAALSKNNEDKEDSIILTVLIVIGLVILCVIFPPLGFILLIARAIILAIPKIKWMFKNIKSGILGTVMLSYLYGLIGLGEYLRQKKFNLYLGEIRINAYIVLLLVFFFSIILISLISKIIKKQAYLSIRTMATFPIMLFLTMLPFIGIGLMVYAYTNSDNSNMLADPGVYQVQGYYRHNTNGGLTYVQPYLRTYPDGSVTNNLSFPG